MNRLSAVFLALFALATAAVPPGAARAAQIVAPHGLTLDIGVNQGQLVKLAKPVNSVFIADPAIADVQVKSPQLVYVIGKAAGVTTLYAVSEQDEVLLNAQVHVRYDAARIASAIRDLVPHSAVAVNAVADSVVLSGTVYSAADDDSIRRVAARFVKDPKQLINKMKLDAPDQINLRVRVAEMDRAIIKQFGFNWDNVFNNGSFAFGLATGVPALIANNATALTLPNGGPNGGVASVPSTLSNLPVGATTNGFNLYGQSQLGGASLNNLLAGIRTKSLNLDTVIDALDNHGLVTILAEPNLTALSGEPANFLAGGEFPIPVPAGNGLVGIDWKKFGVSLNFVGTIIRGDRISLHVSPEVSELSSAGAIVIDSISVPALTTRRADTTVELASGQSFAIAGLLQNNVTQNINKFPWLGDIPVLGQLFRSEAFQRNQAELVIIVTPYIVHPIATASRAVLPTDGYVPSTDGQLVLHADEYQQQPPPARVAPARSGGTGLVGPVGFDLE
ncbi:MAG TPA: type II and III secretion system protein family protein [Stellaceae bacterium]|nr:type II and III secretion system protein family protein [Stellaceae bacterium]